MEMLSVAAMILKVVWEKPSKVLRSIRVKRIDNVMTTWYAFLQKTQNRQACTSYSLILKFQTDSSGFARRW